jgi:hypothetical protein
MAVEVFGGNADTQLSIQDLLHHVTTVMTKHVTTVHTQDASNRLQAYFECLQRDIWDCPYHPAIVCDHYIVLGRMFDTASWRNRFDSRRLVVLVATLWMAYLVFQNTSAVRDQFGPSWTHHWSTMRRRFGRRSSNGVVRLCRLPLCDCPNHRREPQPSHEFLEPN